MAGATIFSNFVELEKFYKKTLTSKNNNENSENK